jgi:hypothetical protein
MHGNHVGLVKLSKRERKRQNTLEEKNKAAAICWWFNCNCTCAQVALKVALGVCEDDEEWPEGRPDASVFSLIQEVLGVIDLSSGRRAHRAQSPPPPNPLPAQRGVLAGWCCCGPTRAAPRPPAAVSCYCNRPAAATARHLSPGGFLTCCFGMGWAGAEPAASTAIAAPPPVSSRCSLVLLRQQLGDCSRETRPLVVSARPMCPRLCPVVPRGSASNYQVAETGFPPAVQAAATGFLPAVSPAAPLACNEVLHE